MKIQKQEETTMNAANTLKKLGIEKTFDYIYKDPDKNMPKIRRRRVPDTKRDDPRSDHRSKTSIL